MTEAEPRAALERLIRDNSDDYVSLSRLIGRNPAYIQQFIRRGTPRRLAEDDRRILADYFGVSESLLGGREPARVAPAGRPAARRNADRVRVPRLEVRASAGPGATPDSEHAAAAFEFDQTWLRSATGSPAAALSAIRVTGDSMLPTLADGDEIFVDRAAATEPLRDGIYVLRIDDALMVKRLAIDPAGRRITVRSDNPAYPPWTDVDPAAIAVVGRVVWVGRRIA